MSCEKPNYSPGEEPYDAACELKNFLNEVDKSGNSIPVEGFQHIEPDTTKYEYTPPVREDELLSNLEPTLPEANNLKINIINGNDEDDMYKIPDDWDPTGDTNLGDQGYEGFDKVGD